MRKHAFTKSLILSLFFHLFMMLLVEYRPQLEFNKYQTAELNTKTIKFKKISPELKKVGIKESRSNEFNTPLRTKDQATAKNVNSNTAVTRTSQHKNHNIEETKEISLESLAPDTKDIPKRSKNISEKMTINKKPDHNTKLTLKKMKNSPYARKTLEQQDELKSNMLKQLSPASETAELIKNNDFNIQFEPPNGVPLDELNSMEKIYYSFQRRTFLSYINSFLKTYQSSVLSNPKVASQVKNEHHLLSGKITFDSEGNIISVKIIQSSTNDNLHKLFEKTLTTVGKIPNPPRDLLSENGEFTIYYQLVVNRR